MHLLNNQIFFPPEVSLGNNVLDSRAGKGPLAGTPGAAQALLEDWAQGGEGAERGRRRGPMSG